MRKSIGTLVLFLVSASPAFAHDRCLEVRERLQTTFGACPDDFSSPIGLCSKGTVRGTLGHATTRFRATMASFGAGGVDANTTISYGGDLEITGHWGVLRTSDVGLNDMAAGVFTEIARVKGGTGRFANATGTLYITGTASADGMTFTADVTGKICY